MKCYHEPQLKQLVQPAFAHMSIDASSAPQTSYSATLKDVDSIHRLLTSYALMGALLPRTKADIGEHIGDFRVIHAEEKLIACGSLEFFTSELAEIRSLMVAASHKSRGFGEALVRDLTAAARQRGIKRLMALTYVPEFFLRLGFRIVNKEVFPEKVWGICVNCYKFKNCDEIAVLLDL